jgi:archaellin
MTDNRGASDTGTLLLLIAMLRVARIPAGVVLSLADYLGDRIDQLPSSTSGVAAAVASD